MVPFCTEEIEGELLSDEALQAKQQKAEKYASEPERFTPVFVEMEVKADHGNACVMYSDDEWSCSCGFFNAYRTCSHVMAVGLVLKPIPVVQPRGNVGIVNDHFLCPNEYERSGVITRSLQSSRYHSG